MENFWSNQPKKITAQTLLGKITYDKKNQKSSFIYWYGKITLDSDKPYLKIK